MNHFAYLIEDQDSAFFTGLRKRAIDEGLTKEASTIGELIKRIPKQGAILKPRLSKLKKVAAALPTEIEILKLHASGMGSFGLTKMAAELMCELELDDESTADELDELFDKLAGTAVAHDLKVAHDELVPGKLTEAEFMEWGRNLLKEAGLFGATGALARVGRAVRGGAAQVGAAGRGIAGAVKHPLMPVRAFRAERAARLARHGEKELTGIRGAIPTLGARAATMPLGAARAGIASRVEGLQAAERKLAPVQAAHQQRANVLAGNVAGAPTATKAKGKAKATPPPAEPAPSPAPGKVTSTEMVPTPTTPGAWAKAPGSAAGKMEAAGVVEKSMKKYKKKGEGGMMDSVNKLFRGEKLSPAERAHVIKAGLGAYAVDRYVLQGGRSD
jgi:hypothetical protein